MNLFERFPRRFRFPWRSREQIREEVDEEIAFHIEMRTDELIALGADPASARAQAHREFGDLEQAGASLRAADQAVEVRRRRFEWLHGLALDLRLALRSLRRGRSVTLAAVLTLGLAIGANTAIFSAVQAVLFRPLPVEGLDELVVLQTDLPDIGFESAGLRANEVHDLMDRRDLFQALAGYLYRPVNLNLTGFEAPQRVAALPTLGDFFGVFDVRPYLGRFYDSTYVANGNTRVVVLSYGFWRDFTGQDPAVVGTTIQLDNESYEVVGVGPPGFQYPQDVQLWTPQPIQMASQLFHRERGRCCLLVRTIARLQSGIEPARVRAELAIAKQTWVEQFPKTYYTKEILRVSPFINVFAGQLRPILFLLLGATGFVLLIACANVASLQLVRAVTRRKELAVRVALGSSRGAIIRYVATEGLLVATAGGVLGVIIGCLVIVLIRRSDATQFVMPGSLRLDPLVLLFSASITIIAFLMVGIIPALRAASVEPGEMLKSVTRGASAGGRRNRILQTAAIVQVALAFTLLLGTGVALRSLARLLTVDPGFRPEGLVAMRLNLPVPQGIPGERVAAQGIAFYEGLLEQLSAMRGVQAVATVTGEPFGELTDLGQRTIVRVVGRSTTGEPGPVAQYGYVSHNYFRTMGIPLIAGRAFAASDDAQSPPVAIIDERLAQELFPGQQVIGQQLEGFGTIVGVVGSVKTTDLAEPAEGAVYRPFRQFPAYEQTVVVRTTLPKNTVAGLARNTVKELDQNVAVEILPITTAINRTLGPRYLALGALGGFGALALVLAVLGIYGVLSYSVSTRAREIAIRLALGATPRNITRGVLLRGAMLAGVGLLAGALIFAGLGRLLSALVFGISARDPLTFVTAAGILGAVSLVATFVPALRASRADPTIALRQE
jgi:putative ABC transport system permease protein